MTKQEMWDKLLEYGVSEETLNVVTNINGYNNETLEDILYAVFGYHDFDDLENLINLENLIIDFN